MKKLLLLVVCVFYTLTTSASHLMGGMIGVFQTNQDSTSVGMWLISDSQGLPMPTTLYVEKWEMNSVGWYVQNGTVALSKVTVATFQGQTLTNYVSEYLDLDSNKYRFIYKNCCWGMLNNSNNSFNSEFIISADYWHIPYNSTPAAVNPLLINQQSGIRNTMKPLWGNYNCFLRNLDNGDVVTVSQTDLHMGYANGTFVPQSYTQISMHVDNDSISWVPNTIGKYGIGFEIKDFRNGQLIGTQRVQWTFLVLNSTVGLDEHIKPTVYQIWDIWGNFIYEGEEIPYNIMNGLYIVKYGGKTEKVWVVK